MQAERATLYYPGMYIGHKGPLKAYTKIPFLLHHESRNAACRKSASLPTMHHIPNLKYFVILSNTCLLFDGYKTYG